MYIISENVNCNSGKSNSSSSFSYVLRPLRAKMNLLQVMLPFAMSSISLHEYEHLKLCPSLISFAFLLEAIISDGVRPIDFCMRVKHLLTNTPCLLFIYKTKIRFCIEVRNANFRLYGNKQNSFVLLILNKIFSFALPFIEMMHCR